MYSDTKTYLDYYKQFIYSLTYIESTYNDNSAIDLSLKKDENIDKSKRESGGGNRVEKYKDKKDYERKEKDEEEVMNIDIKEDYNNIKNQIDNRDDLTLTFYNDDTGEEVVTHHKCLKINSHTIFPEINVIKNNSKELKLNSKYNGETVVPIRETVNNDCVYSKNVDALGAGTSSNDCHDEKTSTLHNIRDQQSYLKLKKFVKTNDKSSSSGGASGGVVVCTDSNSITTSKNKTNKIYREAIANKTIISANNVSMIETISNLSKNKMNKRKYEMCNDNNTCFNSTNFSNNISEEYNINNNIYSNNGKISSGGDKINNNYTENMNFDRVHVKKQKLLDESYQYIPQPWYMNNGVMINKHLNVKRLLLNTFNDYNKCYKYFVEIDNRILNSRNKTFAFDESYNVQSVQKKIMHCIKRYLGDTRIPNIECYRLHCNETNVVFVYFIISLHCKLPFYLQNNGYCLYYTENKSIEHKLINFSKDVKQNVNTMLFTETRFIPESTNFSTLFYMHIMENCVNCKRTLINLDGSTVSNNVNVENENSNNHSRHNHQQQHNHQNITTERVAEATAGSSDLTTSLSTTAATNNIKTTNNNDDEYDISNGIANEDIENIIYSQSNEMILSLSSSSLLHDDNIIQQSQHQSSVSIDEYNSHQRQQLLLSQHPIASIPSQSSPPPLSLETLATTVKSKIEIECEIENSTLRNKESNLNVFRRKSIQSPSSSTRTSSSIVSLHSPIINNNIENQNTFNKVADNINNELLPFYLSPPSLSSSSSNNSNTSSSTTTLSSSSSSSPSTLTTATVIESSSPSCTSIAPRKAKILSNIFQKRRVDSKKNIIETNNELKKNEKDCLLMQFEENNDNKKQDNINISNVNNVERNKKNKKIKRNGDIFNSTYCVGCDMVKQKMPNNGGVDNVRKVFANTKDILSDLENTICRDFIKNLKSNVSETDMTILFQCVLNFNKTIQSCEIENNTNLDTDFQYENTSEVICEISKPIFESLYSSDDVVKTLPVDEKSILEGLLDSWIARDYCNHSFIIRPLSGWCNYLFSWMDLAYEVNSNGEKIIRYTSYELNADKVLIDSSSNLSIIFYDFIIYSTNNSENIYISANSEVEIYSLLTFINKNVNTGWPINKIYSDKYQCYEYNANNGEFKIETRNMKRPSLNGSVCIRCYNIRVSTDTCEVQLIISREIIITNLCKTINYMSKYISNRDMATLSVRNISKAINTRDHVNNFNHRSTNLINNNSNDILWCSNWIQRSINLKTKSDQQFNRNKK